MYQVFGSKTSRDYDLLVFVDQLGTIVQNKSLVKEWESKIKVKFSDKPLNVNLGILQSGKLVKVFKGTVDEVNNSLMDTYELHEQSCPQQITQRVKRDVDLKILRGLRIILSLISRTQHREIVKKALQGDATLKHQTLKSIDLSSITDLGSGKNMSFPDYYKTISFQLGQILGLVSGVEHYTKESISLAYPELENMLNRQRGHPMVVEKYKNILINKINPSQLKCQKEENRE